ncbi:TPA: sigma-70 family RNA polymerase sigma factor [Bacillus cereus]|uniref:RNA polymerase subunit sigma n=3 Tax=Bacillus cereus group TaxID=86661 RepID=A0A9X7G0P6_BACTU|nr:sigma-70 family RNA polymerase sigma factor [Bacillus thuringiensis]PFT87261.1 RNA polymerase subunit sigma [Bacillus thuringiensis]HDW3057795.1 sigma-70 family RNA polymerase sigma factor [Bacillus cereus]
MTLEEVFEDKKNIVYATIQYQFGSFPQARKVAEMNHMELEDLIQIGLLTLWEVCVKFHAKKLKYFNAYASQAIKWKICDELHTKGRLIRVGKHVSYEDRNGMSFHSIDLYRDGEVENEYFAVSPINVEEEVLTAILYQEAMDVLQPEEAYVLQRKSHGLSDREIAREVGRSISGVNQIKNAAFRKINPAYVSKRKGRKNRQQPLAI